MQGENMESSGAVTIIREVRIPDKLVPSDGRRRASTPDFKGRLAVEQPTKSPSTQAEVRMLQLVAVGIVAARMTVGLEPWKARDVDTALKSAKTVTGVWPKAEFTALLSTELLFRAIEEFDRLEGKPAPKDAS